MEAIIISGLVALAQAGVKMAAENGVKVDLTKAMATAAARAGATMTEYDKQLEDQRKLFPDG